MKLKSSLVTALMVLASMVMLATTMDAEAKRIGGGRPAGMQRSLPQRAPDATPNQAAPQQGVGKQAAATPQGAAAQGAAAAGRRSWMGPLAGVAAGLGMAALFSHLGMGEAFGDMMSMVLLAVVAFFAIRWLMGRMGGAGRAAGAPQLAGAGAPMGSQAPDAFARPMAKAAFNHEPSLATPVPSAPVSAAPVSAAPEGFDAVAFERIAKMIFIRLQAANDEANVEDLRKFTTPELFASLRLDLQERGASAQKTDVVQLDAQLVDTAREGGQWVASVRFSGLIREEADSGALPFNELWHLVQPEEGGRDWAIAGITPLEG
jgi:predicted lipid-binding transport protein (Tim44 family)